MNAFDISNDKATKLQNILNNNISIKNVKDWDNNDVKIWLHFLPYNLLNLRTKLSDFNGKQLINLMNNNDKELNELISDNIIKQNFKLILNKIISNPPHLQTLKSMIPIINDYQTRINSTNNNKGNKNKSIKSQNNSNQKNNTTLNTPLHIKTDSMSQQIPTKKLKLVHLYIFQIKKHISIYIILYYILFLCYIGISQNWCIN